MHSTHVGVIHIVRQEDHVICNSHQRFQVPKAASEAAGGLLLPCWLQQALHISFNSVMKAPPAIQPTKTAKHKNTNTRLGR